MIICPECEIKIMASNIPSCPECGASIDRRESE